jgi:organic hydroperoxide reductase OsmC/OhrA
MSSYTTDTRWARNAAPFTYESYDRSHTVKFGSGTAIPASSAPEYKGDATRVNPEETFLAAISSCHMLTFLAVAAKRGFVVDTYEDSAECWLDKDEAAGLSVTRAELRPKICFAGTPPTTEQLDKMHESAHRNCFIARSVKTRVTIVTPAT